MTPALRRAFEDQAAACAALGSPFTARLLTLVADRLHPGVPLANRLQAWRGDLSARGDAVALRLAAGLHHLVLGQGDVALAALYQAPATFDDAAMWDILETAMQRNADTLDRFLDSAPQTNEVRRSAVLIAVAHWLTARFGLPLVLSELGASAGLNLLWDRYALSAAGHSLGPDDPVLTLSPNWSGPPPPAASPVVLSRAGVDLAPVDPVRDRARLLAYIWPDQPERRALTIAALDAAARSGTRVAQGDAAAWLPARLDQAFPGALHLVFHTIAWQYFPASTQDAAEAALRAAGARATAGAPLAHVAMEADDQRDGAALTMRLWPGGQVLPLGRVDFHGRWVRWAAPPLP